jgi:hypothetical protein
MKVAELRELLNELTMEYDGAEVQIETTFVHCQPTELRMVRKNARVIILSEHWLAPTENRTIVLQGKEYEADDNEADDNARIRRFAANS